MQFCRNSIFWEEKKNPKFLSNDINLISKRNLNKIPMLEIFPFSMVVLSLGLFSIMQRRAISSICNELIWIPRMRSCLYYPDFPLLTEAAHNRCKVILIIRNVSVLQLMLHSQETSPWALRIMEKKNFDIINKTYLIGMFVGHYRNKIIHYFHSVIQWQKAASLP